MAESFDSGDHSMTPLEQSVAPAARTGRLVFDPVQVVLREQHRCLQTLGRFAPVRAARRPGNPAPTTADRARLLQLAIHVIDEAARKTESECRRVVAAAEYQAASLVREAQEDVSHLTNWLDAGTADNSPFDDEPQPVPIARQTEAPVRFVTDEPQVRAQTNEMVDPAGPVGDDFFDSFHNPDEDRWSFMFDDDLVGVGPTLRRVLRRPSAARQARIAP